MINLALLCGGKSPEHEIAIRSAKNILAALDRDRYNVQLIGLDINGCWRLVEESNLGERVNRSASQLALVPGSVDQHFMRMDDGSFLDKIDVIFPVLHGINGEDGTIQGLLRCMDIPFVGTDVLASAVTMDKDVAKRLLSQAGLKVAASVCLHYHEKDVADYVGIRNQLGRPLFIKPANMGSSVGVHKVENKDEFDAALKDAFLYDRKVIIEEMIVGRELECAVMGNAIPQVSHVGEVIAAGTYSYDEKYSGDSSAQTIIPANVSHEELIALQIVAKQAYVILDCEGLARVDMFLTSEGDIYVNELNTLPGFTNISMYPKLWEHAGTSYSELLDELISLAFSRHNEQKQLKTTWREV